MRTQIWAHRGASQTQAENTLAAFEEAIRQGADGIELDVQMTADKVVVVIHDESTERVSGVPGDVSRMTLQALQALDVGQVLPQGGCQRVPTLEEVFDLIRPTQLTLNVELKNTTHPYPGLEEAVLSLADKHQMTDRLIVSSFNHVSLHLAAHLIHERKAAASCGILYLCGLYQPWAYARQVGASAIHPYFPNLRMPGLVEACHQAGVRVHAWTLDQPDHLLQAFQLGVDAVITNQPDRAVQLRQEERTP